MREVPLLPSQKLFIQRFNCEHTFIPIPPLYIMTILYFVFGLNQLDLEFCHLLILKFRINLETPRLIGLSSPSDMKFWKSNAQSNNPISPNAS